MFKIIWVPQTLKTQSMCISRCKILSSTNVSKRCNLLPAPCRLLSTTSFLRKDEKQESIKIYNGPLTPQIRAVKFFSLGSSVAGLIAQPILIREASTIGSTSLLVALCSVVGFFTFVTPLLLHLVTKKYVTRIEYNPENNSYTAHTISFFLVEKELAFKPEDVVVPEIPGMFTSMLVKEKPLFVEAQHFQDPKHYAKLLGYDRPMDFKLGSEEIDVKDKKSN